MTFIFFGTALSGLFKAQNNRSRCICSAPRSVRIGTAPSAETAAEKAAEYVSEVTEIGTAETAEAAGSGTCTVVGIYTGMTELIVSRLFILIGQNLISLIDLFEVPFGFLVARIKIRVIFLAILR